MQRIHLQGTCLAIMEQQSSPNLILPQSHSPFKNFSTVESHRKGDNIGTNVQRKLGLHGTQPAANTQRGYAVSIDFTLCPLREKW